jgi:hypothetical protein
MQNHGGAMKYPSEEWGNEINGSHGEESEDGENNAKPWGSQCKIKSKWA